MRHLRHAPSLGPLATGNFPARHYRYARFDAPLKAVNPVLNPHVRFFDGSLRGYLRCELGRDSWRTDVRNVASIDTPVSPVATTASYAVESGRPGIVPA